MVLFTSFNKPFDLISDPVLSDGDGIIRFVSALDVEESEDVVSSALRCFINQGLLDEDIQLEKEKEVQKKSKKEQEREYAEAIEEDDLNINGMEIDPSTPETERWYSFARISKDLSCERAFCTLLYAGRR